MKALTVSQPYASLIGEKWVENRRWLCHYRGPLLIHAGRGTQYMSLAEMTARGLPFGAVVSRCVVAACYHVPTLRLLKERH